MPTDNALSATLLWLATGVAALLLTGLVTVAESSRQRGELRRLHQVLNGELLLPVEQRRQTSRTGEDQPVIDLEPLSAHALTAR